MGRDRVRLLVLLLAYLGLVIATLFVLDWFVIATPFGKAAIDLRTVQVCPELGMGGSTCMSMSFGMIPKGSGWYFSFAGVTFWATLISSLLLAFQAGTRLLSGTASEGLSKLGYFFCVAQISLVMFTGYFFTPDMGMPMGLGKELGIAVERTWAPALLLLGHVLGIVVHYNAVSQIGSDDDVAAYKPLVMLPAQPQGQGQGQAQPQPTERPRPISEPVPVVAERPAAPIIAVPEGMRGKLKYATATAEITRAGIDARREDGSSLLVMWRDVVGVVARRLPPDHDGATFVDLVSNAGATLRLLPWTRLSGDPVEGHGEARARKLVELVGSRCPSVQLDPATRRFVESADAAAQLPDLELLAQHDQRLA